MTRHSSKQRPSRRHRFLWALLGAAATALALAVTALGGSGIGAVFNLGQTNTVNAGSTLTGSTAAPQLNVVNGNGVGAEGRSAKAATAGVLGYNSAGGPGLQALVSSNLVPPLKVNSTALVPNLNANYVSGYPATSFYRLRDKPAANTITTLDSTGNVGEYTSATVGADGLGLISYYDVTHGNLKVAHCSNVTCTSATLSTLASTGDVGQYSSVAIGADGLGLISFYDATRQALMVAHCSNVTCTTATLSTLVVGAGDVGESTAIAIGSDGRGLISYVDVANATLKAAHCTNVACTSATTTTVPGTGTVDGGPDYTTSVAIGADGFALISVESAGGSLVIAHCTNLACSTAGTLATGAGAYNSITIGSDGLALVSSFSDTTGDFEATHCSNESCSSATNTVFETASFGVRYTSATIGPDGLGLITYYLDGHFKVAHCTDLSCDHVVTGTPDTGDVGAYNSVTIGTDGLPLVAYYDFTNANLKVEHCANAFCVSYLRRR